MTNPNPLPIHPGQILSGPNGFWLVRSRAPRTGRIVLQVLTARLWLTRLYVSRNASDFDPKVWRVHRPARSAVWLLRVAVVVGWVVNGWRG